MRVILEVQRVLQREEDLGIAGEFSCPSADPFLPQFEFFLPSIQAVMLEVVFHDGYISPTYVLNKGDGSITSATLS